MTTQTVKLNYLHIAPRKVRLIADALKGLPVVEAEAQLLLRPQRAAKPLLKLLRSAEASLKQKKNSDSNNFVIASIRVDQGPMIKRFLPRAMGRATPIHKKMSHVTLVLEEKPAARAPRFTIVPPPKKEKKKEEKKTVKSKQQEARKEGKPREKVGLFKRFFRRKAV